MGIEGDHAKKILERNFRRQKGSCGAFLSRCVDERVNYAHRNMRGRCYHLYLTTVTRTIKKPVHIGGLVFLLSELHRFPLRTLERA